MRYRPACSCDYRRAATVIGFLALSLLPACTKEDRKSAGETMKETYEDSKAAMSRAWERVKDYRFDRRDEFAAKAKALAAQMDVQLREARANFSEARASASRKAAMEELKNSEADYREKVNALSTATADTWDSAKQNVILAWDRLQAAYYKARTD